MEDPFTDAVAPVMRSDGGWGDCLTDSRSEGRTFCAKKKRPRLREHGFSSVQLSKTGSSSQTYGAPLRELSRSSMLASRNGFRAKPLFTL